MPASARDREARTCWPGSGVDEAWTTGVQLAEAVIELAEQKRAFTRENLEATYVRRRRESWVDDESKIAADSRNGFQQGVVTGMIGMAIAGLTGGRFDAALASSHATACPRLRKLTDRGFRRPN